MESSGRFVSDTKKSGVAARPAADGPDDGSVREKIAWDDPMAFLAIGRHGGFVGSSSRPFARKGGGEDWIVLRAETPSARWGANRAGPGAIETNAPRLALDLAAAGLGRVLLPTFVGDATPSVERVDRPIGGLAHERWLVTHADEPMTARSTSSMPSSRTTRRPSMAAAS